MSLWNRKARFYAFARRLPPSRQILDAENTALRSLLGQAKLPDGAAVLDLGCGYGNASSHLAGSARLFLADRSLPMVRRAQVRLQAPGVVADAAALPFREGTFRLILAIGLLEYIPDAGQGSSEIGRVIGPGGWLLATIAPKNWANRLRRLLGERLFWHRLEALDQVLKRSAFRRIGSHRTWLQVQLLYQRGDVR